ncbi:MAG: FeoB-associated Cys-rich membrane protein [Deltaproteobacteria bacterium]|nr:FeoB-associated Cys-rich membrane protein [Deltaproteobacteria bacterium]
METLLVTAIVLTALVCVVRRAIKKFRTPDKYCCNGNCSACNQTVK